MLVLKKIRIILKAMPQGGAHPTHKYLRREGEPGNWTYIYDDKGDQEAQVTPQSMNAAEGGNKISGKAEDITGGRSGATVQGGQAGGGGGGKLVLGASVLRDAIPSDLNNPQIVLWTTTTEQGAESMRQTARFVGNHQSGGTQFSATREAALNFAKGDSPVLLAAKVETNTLQPHAPAKTVAESLFPEDSVGSLALYPNTVNGNSIVGIVRPGDPLWPKGDDEGEMSRVSEQTNQDTE